MCERGLCRSGYVGSLLNLPAPDSFYFPSLRANGGQLAALPSLPYPRSSLPWTCPSSCAAQPQPQPQPQPHALGGPSQSYLPGGGKEGPGHCGRFYGPDAGAKAEERGRQRPPFAHAPGLPAAASPKGGKGLQRGAHGLFEGDPCAAGAEEDAKGPLNLNVTVPPAAGPPCLRPAAQDGSAWCPGPGRGRKKRKPYTKQQIAELESEFLLSEFINRQKRKELSHRLRLSDQQVKIWFQNRRMKKKRVVMREQALALY
ncbi:homeobox protein Hox-D12 [Alligator mississippiensis]|uniref:homeobox protein Hox-D12 n=1 Tax=Alligator mississippiensis TaxID=8496 RepID=UPI0003D07AD8|nr:homeobox protein Hox-D12 [Alligator mississippiensis]